MVQLRFECRCEGEILNFSITMTLQTLENIGNLDIIFSLPLPRSKVSCRNPCLSLALELVIEANLSKSQSSDLSTLSCCINVTSVLGSYATLQMEKHKQLQSSTINMYWRLHPMQKGHVF